MEEGDRLGTKKELSARLGIAGATLNEAIRLLQERGLVTLRSGPKGGIFVSRPDPLTRLGRSLIPLRDQPAFVEGALEVQESLQALTALNALRQRTEQDITDLRRQLTLLEAAVTDDQAFAAALRHLDETISAIGTNRILQTVYRGVLAYVEANERPDEANARSTTDRRRALRLHQQ